MSHLLAPAALVALLSGCAATYEQAPVRHTQESLKRDARIAIVVPENASYGSENYARSGEYTANALRQAFQPYASQVSVSDSCKSVECVRDEHSGKPLDYVVIPEIEHWEDRATEWSGKPDKIRVLIEVFDAQSSEKLHSTVISGKSQWATMGGDHPQDLLDEPVESFVKSLY